MVALSTRCALHGAIATRDNLLFLARPSSRGGFCVLDPSRGRVACRIGLADSGVEVAGLAVDASRNLYVADPVLHAVRRLTVFGREAGRFGIPGPGLDRKGFLDAPRACALDEDGSLYVACGLEPLVHGVQKFAPDGRCLGSLRSFGEPNERFGAPRGLAVGGGRVVVADTRGECVQVFTTAGVFVSMFSTATRPGELSMPCAVARRADGTLLVAQVGEEPCVKAFSGGGELLAISVEGGAGEGKTEDPVGLALDGDGNFYLLDRGGERVQRFDAQGRFAGLLHAEERLPA
ncbi:MAG TPA: NHL repeat-containing protein [Planctomycetota bacterium]|jgi:DNA-binding beta-propeller fold protein YncE|nr:NHL repeat-containing protein [Planctomycetota bacterium]